MTIHKYIWILYGRSMGRLEGSMQTSQTAGCVPGGSGKLLTVAFLFVSCHSGSEVLTAGYAGAK
jgi:hypothetical protein